MLGFAMNNVSLSDNSRSTADRILAAIACCCFAVLWFYSLYGPLQPKLSYFLLTQGWGDWRKAPGTLINLVLAISFFVTYSLAHKVPDKPGLWWQLAPAIKLFCLLAAIYAAFLLLCFIIFSGWPS